MQRLLTTAMIGGLLIATAAAFAITERLKLTKSPVYGTLVSHGLSPTCGCARGKARIYFILRRPDDLTVNILDTRKGEVDLLAAERFPRGPVVLYWNGRTDGGTQVPDGAYRVRIHLAGAHQTIDLPNRIAVDTKRPAIVSLDKNRDVFSPDGDHQADFVRLTYRLSKPAHIVVFLGGAKILGPTYRSSADGTLSWDGKVGGQALPPGSYTLAVGAVDRFGNSTPVRERARIDVAIRYITIAARRLVVHAGSRFKIGISTDAKRYAWKLGKAMGHSGSPVLRLRAPAVRGRYTLVVEERGHLDRAAVIVR